MRSPARATATSRPLIVRPTNPFCLTSDSGPKSVHFASSDMESIADSHAEEDLAAVAGEYFRPVGRTQLRMIDVPNRFLHVLHPFLSGPERIVCAEQDAVEAVYFHCAVDDRRMRRPRGVVKNIFAEVVARLVFRAALLEASLESLG